ncbi:MAG: peptide chain release factor N(5)-glutamine methyltransferase [Gammaproteobacteria bacterium]|nr:peptide chain release factor N(5)-glutamine methyltransferase [Gammaproteobacteria bacterium]
MSTIKILLQQAKSLGLDSLDAEVLLAHTLQKNRAYLHTWPDKIVVDEQAKLYQHYLARRAQGEPIAYIVGYKEFWSLPIQVTADTLIPRADSESWIHWLLEAYPDIESLRVLDLGTGSGAIALALAHEKPQWSICAVDFSLAALAVAQQNAQHLGLTIEWVHSDWYEAIPGRVFDLILANPPYIAEEEPHWQQGDLRFEPKTALVASDHGLSDLQQIIQQASHHLSAQGRLLIEHGYQQDAAVHALFVAAGFSQVQMHRDYAGQPRWTEGVVDV